MVTPDSKSFQVNTNTPQTQSVDDSTAAAPNTPTSAPKSSTSFKDVLSKKKQSKGDDEQFAQANQPLSIFDLQGSIDADAEADANTGESAAALSGIAELSSKKNNTPVTKFSTNSEFSQEQPDLSGVNANLQGYVSTQNQTPIAPVFNDAPTPVTPANQAQLQQAIDQIVDKLYILSLNGQTDTVMTLKYPPIMAGVDVVISSFASASGEFNIAFHNVSQLADKLLSMQTAQASLRHGLEEKGYLVHIVVVTAKPIEATTQTEPSEQAKQQGQQQSSYQQQQQQQQKNQQG